MLVFVESKHAGSARCQQLCVTTCCCCSSEILAHTLACVCGGGWSMQGSQRRSTIMNELYL